MSIRTLSYVGFNSPATEEWRSFGPEVLGTELGVDGPDGAVRLRIDDATFRVAIHPGESDGLAYLGWDVGDADALDTIVARLAGGGTEVVVGDKTLADLRAVTGLAWFVDPFGFRHELSYGLEEDAPFRAGRTINGFVTGGQGLGHVVLIVPELPAAEEFVTQALGLRASDSIEAGLSLRFFHCPGRAARHHSLALAAVPGMVGFHHLMLEVAHLDDVGSALDIINERQIPLAMSLGRHTNDGMTSFYVRTPSGFEIEYGTGGIVVDDDTWKVGLLDAQSVWGHKPPATGPLVPRIMRRFQAAGASK